MILGDQAGARLGTTVASAGDVNGDGYADLVLGASQYDDPTVDEGAAFILLGGCIGCLSGPVSSKAVARLESGDASSLTGYSVAGAGDVNGDGFSDVIAGAPYFGPTDTGAAFVFNGEASGISPGSQTRVLIVDGFQQYAGLGWSVSSAGDVNGDGYSDVIIGAQFYDAGENNEGAAFVCLSGEFGFADNGLSALSANAQIESNQPGAFLGESVSSAGDVNGDGYGDVIVGAPSYVAGQFGEGAAFIFLGGPAGIADGDPSNAATQLESNRVNGNLGRSVAASGDVNGDGFGDVIVGVPGYDSGQGANGGAAFVYLGRAAGIPDGGPSNAATILESNQPNSYFGYSVASAGDVNGDGFSDVVVGAYLHEVGPEQDEGAAFVFHGSPVGIANGSPTNAAARLESDQAGAGFGWSVAGAGDVNGDGFADLIVGSPSYQSFVQSGAAFLFHGSPAGVEDGNPSNADGQIYTDQEHAIALGSSVAGAGDVDGDGFADVIVGAPNALNFGSGTQFGAGSAFVFHGSVSGIVGGFIPFGAVGIASNQEFARLGRSVASAGDVNGDGFSDVIVGASGYGISEPGAGAAFVHLGNGYGRRVLARQFRGDGSGISVQPWGSSYDDDSFEVQMHATHPLGRGRVKLEVEACAAGMPFGSPGCLRQTTASWADAGLGGVDLAKTVSGLSGGKHYRWRARALYAPYTIVNSGVVSPPNPAHGPWRRLAGQAVEADVPEPGLSISVGSGILLIGVLGRRRFPGREESIEQRRVVH
ncbi:MAG: FG-GAP repeat protein [Deltaproteobacteria bacterium]|nr:FG-GAP repeat protein [Deltaproteobacteria bacterium]